MTKNISPEMKSFLEDLWDSEGLFIDTPLGRGRIESVHAKAGIDPAVMIDITINNRLRFSFSGFELAAEYGIHS